MRLDQALVARGLALSRSQARDQIVRGRVQVDGRPVSKAGLAVTAETRIALLGNAPSRVSRGGEKLAHALDHYACDPSGRSVIDIGASTGGFTEELLRRGAAHVTAVDIGTGQLHTSLRDDPRITVLEQTDARHLSPELVAQPIDAIVCDVSFISLTKVLGPAIALAQPQSWVVALIKPQFELERCAIGKGGIVRAAQDHDAACAAVLQWLIAQSGWHTHDVIPSPIKGKAGNAEFLIAATLGATDD
ncbi:MAG: TlyA family RNA methyltransferase [Pseudomonadota bacterium]